MAHVIKLWHGVHPAQGVFSGIDGAKRVISRRCAFKTISRLTSLLRTNAGYRGDQWRFHGLLASALSRAGFGDPSFSQFAATATCCSNHSRANFSRT